jgi:hypothetical protein
MAQFKVGDRVRLKQAISEDKTSQSLQEYHKGQVTEVTADSYTVQFDDTKAAVEGITEDEIELDE